MRLCDLTHAYTASSGGIRTYIDAKRQYILDRTDGEHLLIVPGEQDEVEERGRLTTVRVAGPVIPGAAPYRLLLRMDKVKAALRRYRPDLVELTSLYTCPWAAFSYRKDAAEAGHPCAVSAYYLTDLPTAYVEPAATRLGGEAVGQWAKQQATRYMQAIYTRLDLAFTSHPEHVDLLLGLGVEAPVYNVPLGVDLDLFHPHRRSDDVRARFDAGPDDLVLLYAGRLDSEKYVHTLVDALERLPAALRPRLVLAGEGPHREALEARAAALAASDERRLFVLPYVQDKRELAALMASADVYLTAGPHETFGLSVVEGQAAGLPVVGVYAGALRERVPAGTGLLGPVADAEAMAANIERVAAERAAMGAAARAHVAASFSWEASFEKIFRAYGQVIPRSSLPAPGGDGVRPAPTGVSPG